MYIYYHGTGKVPALPGELTALLVVSSRILGALNDHSLAHASRYRPGCSFFGLVAFLSKGTSLKNSLPCCQGANTHRSLCCARRPPLPSQYSDANKYGCYPALAQW